MFSNVSSILHIYIITNLNLKTIISPMLMKVVTNPKFSLKYIHTHLFDTFNETIHIDPTKCIDGKVAKSKWITKGKSGGRLIFNTRA